MTDVADDMDPWVYHVRKGLRGFEVLRQYIKQSNEMCRILAGILQERVELETNYARTLSKISGKLTKTASKCLGSMEGAWQAVGVSMSEEAEYHRLLASSMEEFVLQPMRNLAENYHKSRKPVEAAVDKTSRALTSLRAEESRIKKLAYTQAREAEKLYECYCNAKLGSRGSQSDKEVAKMEKKSRASDETSRKSEKEYYDCALKAEASRLDWEASVYKGCAQLQILEVDRLKQCFEMLKKYHYNLSSITCSHKNLSEKLNTAMQSVNVREDIRRVIDQRGCGPTEPEQLLVDFYAEDMTIPMDRDRREHFLKSYHAFAWQDKERETKSKQGIEKLLSVYKTNPKFSDTENQEEIRHKLISADSLLNYLDACQYKFSCSLALARKTQKPSSRLAGYLEFMKDRHGLPQTVLRMPTSELTFPSADGYVSVAARHRPAGDRADGVDHNFSDDDDDDDVEFGELPVQAVAATPAYAQPHRPQAATTLPSAANPAANSAAGGLRTRTLGEAGGPRDSRTARPVIGWCKSKYDFGARDGAELSFKADEVISIYEKVDATWWEGELNGAIGLFPANYVEEF